MEADSELSDPELSDSELSDLEPSDPDLSDPELSDLEPSDPELSTPDPSDPERSDLQPSDLEPSDPELSTPDPSDPERSDLQPSDPEQSDLQPPDLQPPDLEPPGSALAVRPVRTVDGVRLHTETVGRGEPILFIHEFAGDHRTWEPQVRRFSRSHRCLTYAARGYLPSQVPVDPGAYSQQHAVDDAVAVLDAHGAEGAHIVGISMGGFAGLHLAVQHPGRVRSLVVAGTGYGARPHEVERFRGECDAIADMIESSGPAEFAHQYMCGPSRVQLQNKDRRAWEEYTGWLGEHSAVGSAHTMRGVQRGRPSLYAIEADIAAIAAPVLILAGDEDDGCLETSLWLKRAIPRAGLAVLARTGHTLNIEEPDLVNTLIADFLHRVARGAWTPRDPRAIPGTITGFS